MNTRNKFKLFKYVLIVAGTAIILPVAILFAIFYIDPFWGKVEFSDLDDGLNFIVTNNTENSIDDISFLLSNDSNNIKLYNKSLLKSKAKIHKNINISGFVDDSYELLFSCNEKQNIVICSIESVIGKHLIILEINDGENGHKAISFSVGDGISPVKYSDHAY